MKRSSAIIIINGLPMCGKDTFIRKITKLLDDRTSRDVYIYNISSVDKVKDAAEILGWDSSTKNEVDRKFLSDLKQLAKEYNNHSVSYMSEHVENFNKNKDDNNIEILFLQIREPEEIKEMIEKYPDIITLKIDRPRLRGLTMRTALNESDKHTDEYDYDYIIDNNAGKKKFEENINKFIDELFDI
jgi:thiol-disulfide isomerase/thioredoxin